MKKLEEIAFDYPRCRHQVEEFRSWLAGKDELSEQSEVLPFFRHRPQMAVLFGMFNPRIAWADQVAWEFDIFGDFACDLAVGEWGRGAYCFVEFEDARRDSVFQKQGAKATRQWGRRFDHGYSQIIDWAHKLDGRSPSADLLARFDRHEISFEAILVIGRDQHLDASEKQRLNWRNDNVAVNTKKIFSMTFDELLSQFSVRLAALAAVATAGASPGGGSAGKPTPAPAPAPKRPRKGKS
ncbi:MAG TPA: Shedu anti-phage system protein SduA domain-containing protein [Gemmataceae bacterium]|jgi:hypothetical protein|nr:Shedu anti-phage system protein SduA domain-containing protein [Gemmataceae bacterium]